MQPPTIGTRRMRQLSRYGAVVGGVLIAVAMLALFLAYNATQREPEFYMASLAVDPEERAEAGDALEQRVLQLHNDAVRRGRWEAELTDTQINGWLAVDLPDKFPETLPDSLSEPRVAIDPDLARIACRYQDSSLGSIVSVAFSLGLTDEPNEIAIRIHSVRAGALWLPLLESSKQQFVQTARGHGMALRWVRAEGDNVALLKLPLRSQESSQDSVTIETIQLRDGSIFLAGHTETETNAGTSRNSTGLTVDQAGVKRNVQR